MAILQATTSSSHELLSKVPQVTALFWLTKIFATTFGETAGDAVSMSLNLGYLINTFIFGGYPWVCILVETQAHSLKSNVNIFILDEITEKKCVEFWLAHFSTKTYQFTWISMCILR